MKGTLVPQQPDAAAHRRYRSLQCTGCHALGADYGLAYRMFAGPDLVVFHALADALAGESAPISFRSCVLAPGVTRLPVHARTERTDVAIAFAVWMGLEKLADDVADEGSWLKWLAMRAFSRGHRKAHRTLERLGFPVQPIREALARQQRIETSTAHTLEEALEPTRTIAGLAFGALAADAEGRQLARSIGERVGAILFWLDNALDLPRDLRAGRYNALARARDLHAGAAPEALRAARTRALDEATLALAELEPLIARLPGRIAAQLVESAVVRGLRTQLRSLEKLSDDAWEKAETRDLQVWRPALSQVLVSRLPVLRQRLHHQYQRLWWRWTFRARLATSLVAAWWFPGRAWAQEWWPEEPPPIDTAAPPPEVALDGLAINQFDDGEPRPCDIACGSFATCDLDAVCDDCCSDLCTVECQ